MVCTRRLCVFLSPPMQASYCGLALYVCVPHLLLGPINCSFAVNGFNKFMRARNCYFRGYCFGLSFPCSPYSNGAAWLLQAVVKRCEFCVCDHLVFLQVPQYVREATQSDVNQQKGGASINSLAMSIIWREEHWRWVCINESLVTVIDTSTCPTVSGITTVCCATLMRVAMN